MITEREAPTEHIGPSEILAFGREQIDIIDERLAELYALRIRSAYELKLARVLIHDPVYNSQEQGETMNAFIARTEDGPVDQDMALDIIRPLLTNQVLVLVDKADLAAHAGREGEAPAVIESCVAYIAEVDAEIADLVTARMLCSIDIGAAKKDMGLPAYRGDREMMVRERFVELCRAGNVPEQLAGDAIETIVTASRTVQKGAADTHDLDAELRALTLQPEVVQ
jgi:chorismate mutase